MRIRRTFSCENPPAFLARILQNRGVDGFQVPGSQQPGRRMRPMKRLLTVTGVAAMFAVGLAAQQTTTGTSGTTAQGTQTATTGGGQRGGPRTFTGCLRAGDTAGTYTLTNIEGMGGDRSGAAGGTTAGATTTGGGTTTGSTAAGATTTGQAGGRGMNSLMLTADSSVDLKAHVGHKIEVTGTVAGGRRNGDTTSGTTAGGGTTTGGGTTAGGTSTAGTAGTQGGRGGARSMTVTSVKMVSDSCS
jgi:hypothetical protein